MWLQTIPAEQDEIQATQIREIAEAVQGIIIHLIQNDQVIVTVITDLVIEVIPGRTIVEVIIVHRHHPADHTLLVQEGVHLDSEAVHLV